MNVHVHLYANTVKTLSQRCRPKNRARSVVGTRRLNVKNPCPTDLEFELMGPLPSGKHYKRHIFTTRSPANCVFFSFIEQHEEFAVQLWFE